MASVQTSASAGQASRPGTEPNVYWDRHLCINEVRINFLNCFCTAEAASSRQERTTVSHLHAYYEILGVLDGVVLLETDEKQFEIRPGQAVMISPSLMHRTVLASSARPFVLAFSCEPENAARPENYLAFRRLLPANACRPITVPPESLAVLESLRPRENMPSDLWEMQQELSWGRVLLSLLQLLPEADRSVAWLPQSESSGRIFFELDQYINLHYMEHITLESVSSRINVSPKQINTMIRKNYGVSFRRRVIALRMERAAVLLRDTEMPVEDIVRNVGYASPCHFYQAFAEAYQTTPRDFRQTYRL